MKNVILEGRIEKWCSLRLLCNSTLKTSALPTQKHSKSLPSSDRRVFMTNRPSLGVRVTVSQVVED
jgi:hypothetical protein